MEAAALSAFLQSPEDTPFNEVYHIFGGVVPQGLEAAVEYYSRSGQVDQEQLAGVLMAQVKTWRRAERDTELWAISERLADTMFQYADSAGTGVLSLRQIRQLIEQPFLSAKLLTQNPILDDSFYQPLE